MNTVDIVVGGRQSGRTTQLKRILLETLLQEYSYDFTFLSADDLISLEPQFLVIVTDDANRKSLLNYVRQLLSDKAFYVFENIVKIVTHEFTLTTFKKEFIAAVENNTFKAVFVDDLPRGTAIPFLNDYATKLPQIKIYAIVSYKDDNPFEQNIMHNFHIVIAPADKSTSGVRQKLEASLNTTLGDIITADEVLSRYKSSSGFIGNVDDIDIEEFDRWVPRKTIIRSDSMDHPLIEHIKSRAATIMLCSN